MPLLLHWPNHRVAKDWVRVRHIDWLPTLASLAGAKVPTGLSGVDRAAALWPSAFASAPSSQEEEADLFLENGYSRAVVHGDWKLVLKLIPESVRARARSAAGARPGACITFYGDVLQPQGRTQRIWRAPHIYPFYCDDTQLYNLQSDPKEQRNVFSEHPHVVAKLTRLIRAHHRGQAEYTAQRGRRRHKEAERLRAMVPFSSDL